MLKCCASCHFWKPQKSFGQCTSTPSDWYLKRTAPSMTACADGSNPQWTPGPKPFCAERKDIVKAAEQTRAAVAEKVAKARKVSNV